MWLSYLQSLSRRAVIFWWIRLKGYQLTERDHPNVVWLVILWTLHVHPRSGNVHLSDPIYVQMFIFINYLYIIIFMNIISLMIIISKLATCKHASYKLVDWQRVLSWLFQLFGINIWVISTEKSPGHAFLQQLHESADLSNFHAS